MVCSRALKAKRAFVAMLLSLAREYRLDLDINRDSDEKALNKAFRRVLVKIHPDKGGSTVKTQRLQEAREAWQEAKKNPGQPGRPNADDSGTAGQAETGVSLLRKGGFRINAAQRAKFMFPCNLLRV